MGYDLQMIEQWSAQYRSRGVTQADLDSIRDLTGNDAGLFRRYAHRRMFKEPIQFLRGSATFCGRSFEVDGRVYVPNPETENLANAVLQDIDADSILLDVGTGCGSLAITIAKGSAANVYASDIDPHALEVARSNAKKYDAHVEFIESCYLDSVSVRPTHIILDLPYGDARYTLPSIDLREFRHMPPHACFHPAGALAAYEELIESIVQRSLKPTLYFETGKVAMNDVEKIIPEGVPWEYVTFDNYSITRVNF